MAYIQKIEEEKAMKERGQLADNRSFFAKYVSACTKCEYLHVLANM